MDWSALQDDLLYESLTVWETLYFAAMLRLPREMSTEQKKQRVAKVIAALGLNRCKDTIIGLQPRLVCAKTLASHVLLFAFSACSCCLTVLHVLKAHFIICQGTQIVRLTVCALFEHEPSIRSLIQITCHHLLWQCPICTHAHAQIQMHMHA